MKIKCLFGSHNYGSYNNIEIKGQHNTDYFTNIRIETCNRICSDCKKMCFFKRVVDTLNTTSTTKWKRFDPNKRSFDKLFVTL